MRFLGSLGKIHRMPFLAEDAEGAKVREREEI